MSQMLSLGEKVGALKEKLASVPEDKKERAEETLGISSYVCFWLSMQTARCTAVPVLSQVSEEIDRL